MMGTVGSNGPVQVMSQIVASGVGAKTASEGEAALLAGGRAPPSGRER
jgi:hypothetical protein